MFIEVQDTKGFISIINIDEIVKFYQIDRRQVRINMTDGTYIVTTKNIDTLWEEIANVDGEQEK